MNRIQVKKILGKGKYVTHMQEVQDRTGDDQEGRSTYMGILLYKGIYWINVCKDGTFHLHIERSEYADPDLFKLETILAKWVKDEEEGAKRFKAKSLKAERLEAKQAMKRHMGIDLEKLDWALTSAKTISNKEREYIMETILNCRNLASVLRMVKMNLMNAANLIDEEGCATERLTAIEELIEAALAREEGRP